MKQSFLGTLRQEREVQLQKLRQELDCIDRYEEKTHEIEDKLFAFDTKIFVKETSERIKRRFSGDFGNPSESDVKNFLISCNTGDLNKAKKFIFKFAGAHKKPQLLNSPLSVPAFFRQRLSPEDQAYRGRYFFESFITEKDEGRFCEEELTLLSTNPIDRKSPFDQRTPLMICCSSDSDGHTDIARLLLENNCDIYARDALERSALHWCSVSGNSSAAESLLQVVQREELRAKQETGFIEWKDKQGMTSLMIACYNGFDDLVELLTEFGSILDARDQLQGWSALHFACANNCEIVVDVLLKKGARYDVLSKRKETPLDVALEFGSRDSALQLKEFISLQKKLS